MSTLLKRIGNDMGERVDNGKPAPSAALVHPRAFQAFAQETGAKVEYDDNMCEFVSCDTIAGTIRIVSDPAVANDGYPRYREVTP